MVANLKRVHAMRAEGLLYLLCYRLAVGQLGESSEFR
jgi:hypothetical protein